MNRKEKVTNLIVEKLAAITDVKYVFIGPDTMLDPNVISLNFSLSIPQAKGTVTFRTFIDMPILLKAQYDHRSNFYDQVELQRRIDLDLKEVSAYVNQLV